MERRFVSIRDTPQPFTTPRRKPTEYSLKKQLFALFYACCYFCGNHRLEHYFPFDSFNQKNYYEKV